MICRNCIGKRAGHVKCDISSQTHSFVLALPCYYQIIIDTFDFQQFFVLFYDSEMKRERSKGSGEIF